jgi:hypothetical protein
MLRAFWGAAPRMDCWAGMRARDLLASIIEGRIEKRESVVSLCREFSRAGWRWLESSGGASEFRNSPVHSTEIESSS